MAACPLVSSGRRSHQSRCHPIGRSSTRIEELDALRGLVLAGILLVNIMAFASPYYGSGVIDPQFADV